MSFVTAAPSWVFHPRRSPERAERLARALGLPLPVAHALVNRGVDDEAKAERFLDPALENLHYPAEMLDLERAAERILAAVAAGEKILVHGDYDVDGITSTFLLYSVLLELGARAEYRIPHRVLDGYGLSEDAVDDARRRGCALIVTVDCGITANKEVAYATSLGIETIITDHHEPKTTLPEAYAIVNPLRPGCPYPFKSLAGVGVTFKLVERLLHAQGGIDRAQDYLDIVAMGTIADVVPLVGENRVLAQRGLDLLNQKRRRGLEALVQKANLSGKRISSGQVAFVLAPRINAAGRVGHAEHAVRLLLARDDDEARSLAQSLEDDNDTRRKLDTDALKEAERRVQDELAFPECSSILLWSDTWHPGVIGIVASRLVERYQRPVVLIALNRNVGRGEQPAQAKVEYRGSGRSLPGLDLTKLLDGCSDLLVTYGGHAFAAGLTVDPVRLPELRERFEQLVRAQLQPDQFVSRFEIDADLSVAECTIELVQELERLAPHGLDNSEPLFQMLGARVEDVRRVGADKHVRFTVRDGDASVEAIGFGMGDKMESLRTAGRADLLFVPTRNEWRSERQGPRDPKTDPVQLKLKSVRVS